MTNQEAKILLDKYNQGLGSAAEAALLQYWFIHEASSRETDIPENELQRLIVNMRKEVMTQTKPKIFKLWPRIAMAVAALAVITVGIWLYYIPCHSGEGRNPAKAQYADDVAPGRNTATLTLANGNSINLSDTKTGVVIGGDKLVYTDGSLVRSTSGADFSGSQKGDQKNSGPRSTSSLNTPLMLSASTPRGGTYQVTLPDGSKVWLNADSKISFPNQFYGGVRKVALIGEAYFEVNKDKKRPFVVESNGQEVTVLGTHFNIKAYTDEPGVKTTLLEGSVLVRKMSKVNSSDPWSTPFAPVVLKPGEQAVLDGAKIKVAKANLDEAIAWKNGYFRFNDEKITSIMAKLARWYNIEFEFESTPSKEGFNGKVSRFKNISQVLKMLEETDAVHFKMQGRKVIVTK